MSITIHRHSALWFVANIDDTIKNVFGSFSRKNKVHPTDDDHEAKRLRHGEEEDNEFGGTGWEDAESPSTPVTTSVLPSPIATTTPSPAIIEPSTAPIVTTLPSLPRPDNTTSILLYRNHVREVFNRIEERAVMSLVNRPSVPVVQFPVIERDIMPLVVRETTTKSLPKVKE
jgi:hypothetical protein